ncbi:hypothetical protein F4782DRAFT_310336 [Xylaria castorea]|nr:hypothetical protein F4782DRAFT_310336 [Xylaria castorea]
MVSTIETMGASLKHHEGWRSRIRDKLSWRRRSSASPGPSIVDNQEAAENVSVVEKNQDLTEVQIKRDTPSPPIQPSVITESVPQVRLELTLTDNTQQVISLNPNTPAGQWTDVWSMAYHEAVASFSKDVQQVIMQGKNFEELLQKLEETDEANKGESIFRRGLDNLQKPLGTCKLVLDFAEPFLSMEPTAATAAGVVQGVTTVAIGICGAASELSEQIQKMLECIPYVDRCDALDRNGDGEHSVHKALVYVYIDLLNFYLAAFKIVNSKYFVLKVVASHLQATIPTIVGRFVAHADLLKNQIHNAT